ncbi:hypothetical protein Leryth_001407, partial [Lithospermum erythrorhizon]
AEKCRQLVGEEAASKSGQFSILICFDGSYGTAACLAKQGVKLYANNIRSSRVESARNQAIETALVDALSQGMDAKAAATHSQNEGKKAAKLATRQNKRIIGPIISSGWDFFESLYYGGTVIEASLRGTGALFGTYYFGFVGERKLGRVGYLVGSQVGSWIGGEIGLMVYDLVNGVYFFLEFSEQGETNGRSDESYEPIAFETSDGSLTEEPSSFMASEYTGEMNGYDPPVSEDLEVHEDL